MGPPGSTAPLESWLRWLETLAPCEIDLGLERVAQVLDRLQLPRAVTVLTVGGTNGKGSCVTMLEALLRVNGSRTGAYTSPHILHYAERIRINGQPVDDATIVAAFGRIEAARDGLRLTYFEYGTIAALCVFAAERVDTVVLEVGLGGRLDAVNAIDPDACLITNVSLDHCDWLGDNIEVIAQEKAGIMRAGRPVIFGSGSLPAAIETAAQEIGAQLVAAGRDYSHSALKEGCWDWAGRERKLSGLAAPRLRGQHQLDNASAVLALLEAAGRNDLLRRAHIDQALSRAYLAGRLQRVDARGRRWLLDGAHNPAGARALAAETGSYSRGGRVIAVVGILDDKDAAGIVAALEPHVDQWIAMTADCGRAIPAPQLGLAIAGVTRRPCRVEPLPAAALQAAVCASSGDDLILVAGSFYTIAAALRELDEIRD
jgi:dihydrofolate synthase/folylpolyglutamate synthase